MIKANVSVHDVIELLNDLVERDRDGMGVLVNTRIAVEPPVAHHPTVQVLFHKADDGRTLYLLGTLGLLNGLFGVQDKTGVGAIAAIYEVTCQECGLQANTGQRVGEECKGCGGPLVPGQLVEFALTDAAQEDLEPLPFDGGDDVGPVAFDGPGEVED